MTYQKLFLLTLAVLPLSTFEESTTDCDIKDFPFYVHFHHTSGDTTTLCGGSLISPRTVLTAAHCCAGKIEGKSVIVGNPATGTCAQYMSVSDIIIHKDYIPEIPDYDYCILSLERSITIDDTANIINIPEKEELRELLNPTANRDENFWVMGYNKVEGNLECVATQLSIDEVLDCVEATNNTPGFNRNTMFCHYAPNYIESECVGDPGAPIVYEYKQVGLVSWAHDKQFCFDSVRVGSRLDQVLDWIYLNGNPQYGMRTADGSTKIFGSIFWFYIAILSTVISK